MRTIKYLIAGGMLVAMAAAGSAQAQVAGSSHDLSSAGEEICVYCHTPHNGDTATAMADAPLWNRTITSTTFVMYSSPTQDMIIAGDPQGVSLACLSCHDGVTAYNSIIRGTASNIGVMALPFAVGSDGLGNDHPISVTYDDTADLQNGFNPLASLPAAMQAAFYGAGNDQLECATCHNPHDQATFGKFLRFTNVGSVMCTTCHIK